MKETFYYVLHVASVVLLTGFAFQALASADARRKRFLAITTGVLALGALAGGFGLLAVRGYGFPLWIWIKLGAWIGLGALSGLAFRAPRLRGPLTLIGVALVVLAVWAVYARPS
jgi:hypothetical protein